MKDETFCVLRFAWKADSRAGIRTTHYEAVTFMRTLTIAWITLCTLSLSVLAQTKPLYENNFEKAEVGKVPEDFLVLEGGFAGKEEGGNKFLELPGTPLDSFAVQFGPAESSNVAVSARIKGAGKGRRFPVFGVGLNGVAGYKLQLSPGKKLLELYKDQELKASVAYEWKSGEWTSLRLQISKTKDGAWKVEGKAWLQGSPEPAQWLLTADEKEEPSAGRASIFGSPYSGTPIQFDDLVVASLTPQSKSEQLIK